MEAREIVRRLVDGQKNLSRIQTEVRSVVRSVIWHAKQSYKGERKLFNRQFETARYVWQITGEIEPHDVKHLMPSKNAKLLVSFSEAGKIGTRMHRVYGEHDENTQWPPHLTQAAHDLLPVFVQEMIKEFPGIEKSWKHVIDASYVTFNN